MFNRRKKREAYTAALAQDRARLSAVLDGLSRDFSVIGDMQETGARYLALDDFLKTVSRNDESERDALYKRAGNAERLQSNARRVGVTQAIIGLSAIPAAMFTGHPDFMFGFFASVFGTAGTGLAAGKLKQKYDRRGLAFVREREDFFNGLAALQATVKQTRDDIIRNSLPSLKKSPVLDKVLARNHVLKAAFDLAGVSRELKNTKKQNYNSGKGLEL